MHIAPGVLPSEFLNCEYKRARIAGDYKGRLCLEAFERLAEMLEVNVSLAAAPRRHLRRPPAIRREYWGRRAGRHVRARERE